MKTPSNLPVAVIGAGPLEQAAAARVELDLPETGDCSLPGSGASEGEGCCGGAPKTNAEACCKLDEDAKAAGESGCGCGGKPAPERPKTADPSCGCREGAADLKVKSPATAACCG